MKILCLITFWLTSFMANATSRSVFVGDGVIDADGLYYGEVREVYANGKVKVTLENTVHQIILNTKDVGLRCRCVENICKGDPVIDQNNVTGTVAAVYDNGIVKMSVTNSVINQTRTFRQLGMDTKCVESNSCSCR